MSSSHHHPSTIAMVTPCSSSEETAEVELVVGYLPKLNFIECILLIYYELGTVSIITLEVTGVSAPRPP